MAEPRKFSAGEVVARNYARLLPSQKEALQREIIRTSQQVANVNRLLNREEESTYWDGGPYMRGFYNRDNPRRKNGRYRTRNGEPIPSEYESRRRMIERAVARRMSSIKTRYNL